MISTGDQGACEWGRGGAWLCLLLRTPPNALGEKGCPKCLAGGPDLEGDAGRPRAPLVWFLVKRPSSNLPLWETEAGSFFLPRSPKSGPIETQWTFGGLPFLAACPSSSCRPCCSSCPCAYAGCGRIAFPSDFSQPPQGSGLSLLITMNCWACIRVPALKRLNVLFSPSQKSYTLIETLGTQPCIAALWS